MPSIKRFVSDKPLLTFSLGVALFLSACGQSAMVHEEVREAEIEAQQALDSFSPNNAASALQVDNTPWYGTQAVLLQTEKDLPVELTAQNAVTLTFANPVSLNEAARKIESVTGVPVLIARNVYETSMGDINGREFIPSGGQEVSGGRVVWSGPLHVLLNQMSNIYGTEWSYDNGTINFTSELTKTFTLNALSNAMTVSGAAKSAGGGSSSSSVPSIAIDEKTTLEIWGEISDAVESILGKEGKASFSPSTGTITVTGHPDVLRRVENYLRYQNEMRLRRIAVSVKILSVTTSDASNYSIDLNGIIQDAIGDYSIESSSGADGLSIGILQDGTDPSNLTATLEASDMIERVNIVHSGSLITLSDQPAPLQVGRQIAYLQRVSASSDDTNSVSLEPGTIDVGLFMTVLPRIVDNDKILMRLSIAITNADPNFRTFGSGDIQIELPEVDTTGFLQNAVLSNNETLVLAGFEKRQNDLSNETNPVGFLLGGSRSTNRGRELLVLLINSRILPQQPLTVIGQ